jgi:hypothetical protein
MLRDENQEPFVPMVSADSIYMNDGKSFEEKLAEKIGIDNLAEGAGINFETKDDVTTISVDFGASDNIIDNLDTTVAGQGPLDARQGNVLKNMIPTIVDNLDSTDATKVLSANQGRELKEMSVPVGGATGQVLKKASNSDHELEWGDAADPNAIVGDGTIMSIVELSYADYKAMETAGELKADTEYHITDVENGTATYMTEEQIQELIDASTDRLKTQINTLQNTLNGLVAQDVSGAVTAYDTNTATIGNHSSLIKYGPVYVYQVSFVAATSLSANTSYMVGVISSAHSPNIANKSIQGVLRANNDIFVSFWISAGVVWVYPSTTIPAETNLAGCFSWINL